MQYRKIIPVILSFVLVSACAPVQPPKPDPFKDELVILQKQFLELQRLQIETRARLDESNAKIKALEERQPDRMNSQSQADPKRGVAIDKKTPSQKKKIAKKAKKKVRRQE